MLICNFKKKLKRIFRDHQINNGSFMVNQTGPVLTNRVASAAGLPAWFKQRLPDVRRLHSMRSLIHGNCLHTVCESARCPNMGECWGQGVATLMILGEVCTRGCRFCAVSSGHPQGVVDEAEPMRVADAVEQMGLRYAVITSVTRDDLSDQGASQFARTVKVLRQRVPDLKIELLIPDFAGREDCLQMVIDAGADVLGHNMEMPASFYARIRPQADYQRSLKVLRFIKEKDAQVLTKSGFMLGFGESDSEVFELMRDVRETGCDLLTIGQYLAPSKSERHVPVREFVPPFRFEEYRRQALRLGFKHVFSAPLVRSSFIAEHAYRSVVDGPEATGEYDG